MKYREPTKAPCNDCPFRVKAAQGWLGAGSPESFIEAICAESPLPCHQTIDYEDPKWKQKWNAQAVGNICAGALIMSANICKSPRDREFPRMKVDKTAVFATHKAFIDYHNASDVKSWERDDEKDGQ